MNARNARLPNQGRYMTTKTMSARNARLPHKKHIEMNDITRYIDIKVRRA